MFGSSPRLLIGSEPFLTLLLGEISATDKKTLRLFWPFPRLVIQLVSLPLFAKKSFFLASALVMSLGLCLEIYPQSLILRQPGTLTFVFCLKLWLS